MVADVGINDEWDFEIDGLGVMMCDSPELVLTGVPMDFTDMVALTGAGGVVEQAGTVWLVGISFRRRSAPVCVGVTCACWMSGAGQVLKLRRFGAVAAADVPLGVHDLPGHSTVAPFVTFRYSLRGKSFILLVRCNVPATYHQVTITRR